MKRRILSSLMALVLVFGLLPATAFAAKDELTTDEIETVESMEPGGETGGTTGGETSGETPSTPANAAKIGTTEFATIAEAIAGATDTDTIELLRDVKENITIGKSLTLDLAGFTLVGADEKSAVVTITGAETTVTIMGKANAEERSVNGTITGGKNSGIRITNADVTLKNLTVTENKSTGSGGGIDAVKGKKLVVEQCAINENTAKNKGGGIHVEDTLLKVIDSEIKNNQGFHGAGINLSDTMTPVCGRHEITGTRIEGNKVLNDYGIGGGIHIGTTSEATIQDSTIKNNTADQGGGIGAYTAASVILDNVSILENHATVGAGILALTDYACDTELKLQNNTEVKDNTAVYYGGGLMAWNDCSTGKKQVVTVENSSICNNNAVDGAGIFINFEEYAKKAFVTINLGTGAVVQGNTATRNGGGICARNLGDTAVSKGTINVAEGSALYNNTAKVAGDDLYLKDHTTFTLPKASEMSGEKKLADGTDITGWFYDGKKGEETTLRWNGPAPDGSNYYDEYTPVSGDTVFRALKAAHAQLFTLTYNVTGDLPEGYTAPTAQSMLVGSKYTVAEVPESVTGTKDGVNGTFTFVGWKDKDGKVLSGEQELKDDITLYGIWTFTKKSSGGGGGGSTTYYYFAIEKVDAQDGHALNGAKFGLYLDGKQVATATSNRSGIALFRVSAGDYRKINAKSELYYQELTAPEGYVVSGGKIDMEKDDLTTNQAAAEKKAETVRNYRGSTPDLLNDADHFAYVIGYKDGNVRPYGLISRAETTTIFFRLLKDSVRDGNLLTSNTYTDVADDYWANTAISTMTGLGIVQGRSADTFDPKAPITRAQFAAICARFDTGKSSGTQTFTDIKGHWAEKYIERAAELGWIKGFEDGTFRPDTYITRAQAMTMINRVLNRIPEENSDLLAGMNTWPDCNPGDWFYLAVQEATNSHAFTHKAGNYETWTGMNKNPDWTRYEH